MGGAPNQRRPRPARRSRALATLALVLGSGACSDGGDGSPEAFCAVVADRPDHGALFAEGFDPTRRDRALEQLRIALADLDELRDAAPAEVHDALDAERRYVEALATVVESADPDDAAATVRAVNALDGERGAAEVAALELAAYAQAHCGSSTADGIDP